MKSVRKAAPANRFLPASHLRGPLASAVLLGLGSGAMAQSAADLRLAAAQSTVETVEVRGRGQQTRDLPTMRGPVIDQSQLVSTISNDVLIDRQVVSLEDALRNVAGVTTQVGEGGVLNGDQFTIRGQAAKNDIFTDGLRDFGAFTRDAFNFDQVAVLKGPSSTALGRGVSGGAINSGSKMARGDASYTVNGGLGTADYRRLTFDANKPFSDTVAGRINLMVHENKAPDRDRVQSERWGIAPSLRFELGDATSLDLIGFHQQEDRVPDYGVPVAVTTAADDSEVPVSELGVPASNFFGYNADTDDVKVSTFTALLRHEVSPTLSLTSDTKYGVYDRYFRQTVASCPAACGNALRDNDPATVPMAHMGGPGPYEQTTTGIQNVSTALFTAPIGEMRSEFLVGWDLSWQENDREQWNYAATRADKDLFAPPHAPNPALAANLANVRDTKGRDYALIVDERLWLHPEFSINAGLRFQNYTNEQTQTTWPSTPATNCNGVAGSFTSCTYTRKADNELVNPKVAAMWEPSEVMSFYVSWSESSTPPGNSVGNGDALSQLGAGATISSASLDPETSEMIDIGAKFGLFHQRLLLQAGIYQIERDNSQEVDPATGNTITSPEPSQELRGAELSLSGVVADSLLLSVNYAYIDAINQDADPAEHGKQIRYVPETSASAWATWTPAGRLDGFEFGLGLNHQSEIYLNFANTQVTPSYTAIDGLLSYNFQNARIALNGYNLTDEKYYSQVNGGRVVPAAGRSFVASLMYSF
jgi:catecholate siderophore receptor